MSRRNVTERVTPRRGRAWPPGSSAPRRRMRPSGGESGPFRAALQIFRSIRSPCLDSHHCDGRRLSFRLIVSSSTRRQKRVASIPGRHTAILESPGSARRGCPLSPYRKRTPPFRRDGPICSRRSGSRSTTTLLAWSRPRRAPRRARREGNPIPRLVRICSYLFAGHSRRGAVTELDVEQFRCGDG